MRFADITGNEEIKSDLRAMADSGKIPHALLISGPPGIGKMLMERVEELAKERGISMIGLASGFQRTEAHEFYERLGYQKTSFRFSKRI